MISPATRDILMKLDDLRKVELIRPTHAKGHWKGVPHGTLVDAILAETKRRKWTVTAGRFTLNQSKTDLTAAIRVVMPNLAAPEGQEFTIGVLTSNNRRRALRLAVGTTVMVCLNGMVTGQIVLAKKHCLSLSLEKEISLALDEYVTHCREIPRLVNKMRNCAIKEGELERILIEAGRKGALPWSRLEAVDHEYTHPKHTVHGKGTAWTLFNAFTEVVKKQPAADQIDCIDKFRMLLPCFGPTQREARD